MKRAWIVALVLVSAAVGGAAGAGVTLLLRSGDEAVVRGTLVHLGPPDSLAPQLQPFCLPLHHFCITQAETGNPVALYTYDPHPIFRGQGCEVVWYGDRNHDNQDGSVTHGTFDDPCGGSVYDITGGRLFGPTPRDLDSFSVKIVDSETIVDTCTLVCGELRLVKTGTCPRAPLGD